MYGTGTCDTMNKFRVNGDMYGSPMRLAYPDVTRTDFFMIIGANPVVSGNTLYHLPGAARQLKAVTKRGGRVVFVNPRRVESAKTGEHVFIRPDTDLWFLAAFCNELIASGTVDRAHVDRTMRGFDALAAAVAPWTPERQAEVTGVPAETLRELVAAHVAAKGAALYMATGVNQGRHGTPCFWLLEAINAISGNLDRPGGTLMGSGLLDMAAKMQGQLDVRVDRADGFPTVSGQQPAGLLADDILSGKVRALVVEASNPLLACPNPDGRLTRALEQLDVLVCIDLFRNETGNLADYVLPAPTWLERAEIPYALQSFAGCTPTPYITYVDAAVEPAPGVRHEWWIYTRLADAMGVTLFGNRLASAAAKLNARLAGSRFGRFALGPEMLLDRMLRSGGQPKRTRMLRDHPHGRLLPQNPGHNFLGTDRVLTADGRVDLAPSDIVDTFGASAEADHAVEVANRDRMKLIGKRELNRMNTTSSNAPRLVSQATNYAYVHPDDAARLGLVDGADARVRSAFGAIVVPVRITDELMPGTVAIPQCWGHADADGLTHARRHPGVNSNLLAGDGPDNTERLSGMSHLSGILVDLAPVEVAASSGVTS
jgi:anaerobic selenocysteine-containing dehydrogenase